MAQAFFFLFLLYYFIAVDVVFFSTKTCNLLEHKKNSVPLQIFANILNTHYSYYSSKLKNHREKKNRPSFFFFFPESRKRGVLKVSVILLYHASVINEVVWFFESDVDH